MRYFIFSLVLLSLPLVSLEAANKSDYKALKLIQSHKSEITIAAQDTAIFKIGFKNTGKAVWEKQGKNFVSLYTAKPNYRQSPFAPPPKSLVEGFADSSWYKNNQIKLDDAEVKPGQLGYFTIILKAPKETGLYKENFRLAAEDLVWIPGGDLEIPIKVTNPKQTPNPKPQTLNPNIRIAITSVSPNNQESPIKITASTGYQVQAGGEANVAVGAHQITSVSYNSSTGIYTIATPSSTVTTFAFPKFISAQSALSASSASVFEIKSYECRPAWNPALVDNRFRGNIEVRFSSVSQKLWVINELPLEDYLLGIAEVSNGFALEHTKAMTVISRTYAFYHLSNNGKHKGEPFHLKNSVCNNGDDQVYRGFGFEERALSAGGTNFPETVKLTQGQILTYNNNPIIAAYSSDSGGQAKDARQVWSSFYNDHPYLWGINLQGKPILDPSNTKHKSAQVRAASHGVGLCSVGSQAMAENGATYDQILKHYFPGAEIGYGQ